MIRIENLTKRYGETEALRGVSLDIAPGELFAYLGPNGSGKTTTIKILSGLASPDAGSASIGGRDVVREPLEAKRLLGLVSQTVNLDMDLTVRENLDLHGRLFAMPARRRAERIKELLDYVDMADRTGALVKSLSGGLKRRVMIARALMHEPAVIFLDEPSVGLDPAIRRRIWSLIKKIQAAGATVFLTTHYIEEAEFLADRAAFLNEGRVVAVGSPRALMDELGQWAVDEVVGDGLTTRYFQSREEAAAAASGGAAGFSVRRVNLEDAFMRYAGRKAAP